LQVRYERRNRRAKEHWPKRRRPRPCDHLDRGLLSVAAKRDWNMIA